jgi:DNA polymerase III delta subunit
VIYYCYGADSYRRIKEVRALCEKTLLRVPSSDVRTVDFEEDEEAWKKVRDFVRQPSMFENNKMVCVHESHAVEEKGEREWIKLLKTLLHDTHCTIIISDSTDKPRKAFSFLLASPAHTIHTPQLEGKLLDTFLQHEATRLHLTFEKEAWNYFLAFIHSRGSESTWNGVRELEKLALMEYEGAITEKQLRATTQWTAMAEIFSTARKLIGSEAPTKKIMILEWLLAQGEEPARLFNLLAYIATGSEALHLADLDVAVKSGNAEYEEALLQYVLS